MGLFWTSKPTISKRKFEEKIRGHLYGLGFTHKEIDEVQEIFRGDLEDKHPGSDYAGLTEKEIESGIKWMRENQEVHKLSEKKIDELEESFKKFL